MKMVRCDVKFNIHRDSDYMVKNFMTLAGRCMVVEDDVADKLAATGFWTLIRQTKSMDMKQLQKIMEEKRQG